MAQAYCGPAPVPDDLWLAWNPDLAAIGLCVALTGLHAATRREGRLPLAVGVATLGLLFLSPLCALTVALFSARALHHVVLIAVAAPLLALAFPQRGRALLPLGVTALLHAAALWFWHLPQAYDAGIGGALPYWAMQASLLGTGVLLWRQMLADETGAGAALLALLATIVQMGMLGALLVFARSPLYAPHLLTTEAFGLSPLADQQLAGLVMWVPAVLPYLAAAVLRLLPLAASGAPPAGRAS